MFHVTIDGELIETTPEHPFYSDAGEWVDAIDLSAGDHIRRLDGTFGTVEAVRVVETTQQMYNFTVGTAHTYFVGDGQWLVHNTGCFLGTGREIFGETRLGTIHLNRPLGELTDQQITKAFSKTDFKINQYFFSRLRHPRLQGLNIRTLKDVENILNNGNVYREASSSSLLRIERGNVYILYDEARNRLWHIRPTR